MTENCSLNCSHSAAGTCAFAAEVARMAESASITLLGFIVLFPVSYAVMLIAMTANEVKADM